MPTNKNVIDNKIISFYINTNQVYDGVVEVGKWDMDGIQGNRYCKTKPNTCVYPKVHKTVSAASWDMYLADIMIKGTAVNVVNKFVIIDPSERLITMSESDLIIFNK